MFQNIPVNKIVFSLMKLFYRAENCGRTIVMY